jgi:hypothetical protein
MHAKDWPLPTVEIRCDHCGRHGRYRKQGFVDLVGEDTALSEENQEYLNRGRFAWIVPKNPCEFNGSELPIWHSGK